MSRSAATGAATRPCAGASWEPLVFGSRAFDPAPRIPFVAVLRACLAYRKACLAYRRRGFAGIRAQFAELQAHYRPLPIHSDLEAERAALNCMVVLRVVGRFLGEGYLCLEESSSLAAGLIALGLPAQVVIGKPGFAINPRWPFHAWVEVGGIAINESPLAQRAYGVVLRHPVWRG